MDRDVCIWNQPLDDVFNLFREAMGFSQGFIAIDQNVDIHEKLRPGITEPHIVAIGYPRYGLYCRDDLVLDSGGATSSRAWTVRIPSWILT